MFTSLFYFPLPTRTLQPNPKWCNQIDGGYGVIAQLARASA